MVSLVVLEADDPMSSFCCRYGFGDCRRSLHESAVLVEEIVHQQMASLVSEDCQTCVCGAGLH